MLLGMLNRNFKKNLYLQQYLLTFLLSWLSIFIGDNVQSGQNSTGNKLFEGFCMYPFSFEELQNIPDFTMQSPQFLKASDGTQLAYYAFMPDAPSSVVIFYAGAGLYGNKTYQWVGECLQKHNNIGCYIVDIRGHGHSEGPRGDAPSIEQVFQDVDSFVIFVKQAHSNIPVFLAGHSSGSGLLINYNKHGHYVNDISGYIFLAPYLGPNSNSLRQHNDPQQSFVKKVCAWVYMLNIFIPLNFLQHLTAVYFNYPQNMLDKDPLIVNSYTYAMSCATTPYDVQNLFAALKKPFGLYIGQEDEQFIPEKIVEYKNLALDVNDNSIAKIVPNAQHLSILLEAPKLIAETIIEIID
jgi:acylglycerol lipase